MQLEVWGKFLILSVNLGKKKGLICETKNFRHTFFWEEPDRKYFRLWRPCKSVLYNLYILFPPAI